MGKLKAVILGGLVAAGLTGCASIRADRDWFYAPANTQEFAKLVYGRDGTDDVDLVLWCRADKHEILFEPVGGDDDRFRRVTLGSGTTKLDLSLREETSLGAVGTVGQDSPLLSAFRTRGRLFMVLDGKRRLHLNANSLKGQQRIHEFFEACR